MCRNAADGIDSRLIPELVCSGDPGSGEMTWGRARTRLVAGFDLRSDEAENDGPKAEAEDGSNVVSVDFTRKK